jgi:hypothetical protein
MGAMSRQAASSARPPPADAEPVGQLGGRLGLAPAVGQRLGQGDLVRRLVPQRFPDQRERARRESQGPERSRGAAQRRDRREHQVAGAPVAGLGLKHELDGGEALVVRAVRP